jgi:uncharacterized RDD family membrane protein YckC
MPPETDPALTGAVRLATGEAVEFEVRVARLGSRALALLVDIVVEVLLFWAGLVGLGLVITATTRIGLFDGALGYTFLTVLLVAVIIGYPVLTETLTRGRTLGKLCVGLRTVRDDGGPVRFRHALIRALVGSAVEWPGVLLPPLGWCASLWTMLVSPRGKRLGDYAAGTIVIHERTPAAWGWVPAMPPVLIGWARTLDLTGLDDELALAVRHFLARNRQLREPARSALGAELAAEVAARTTPPPPPGTPGWAYLAAVLAERNRRAGQRLASARAATVLVWPELAAALTPAAYPLVVPPPRKRRRRRKEQAVTWRG